MKKYKQSIQYILFLLVGFFVLLKGVEYYNDPLNFAKNPQILILGLLLLVIIILREVINIELVKKYKPEETVEKEVKENIFTNLLNKLNKSKPIEKEQDILLDHDYDGIKELDNSLPPWWLYSFYISIVFAVFYLSYYHIFGGNTNAQTFQEEMKIAQLEIEAYKRDNEKVVNLDNMNIADNTEKGKKLFKINCAVCHSMDGGGGIGPNLTDKYWILGGGIENIYNTIAEGGRDGKGMVAWKKSMNEEKMQQLASYVLSLQGTTPEKPKEKEGELWEDETIKETENLSETDSISTSDKK